MLGGRKVSVNGIKPMTKLVLGDLVEQFPHRHFSLVDARRPSICAPGRNRRRNGASTTLLHQLHDGDFVVRGSLRHLFPDAHDRRSLLAELDAQVVAKLGVLLSKELRLDAGAVHRRGEVGRSRLER